MGSVPSLEKAYCYQSEANDGMHMARTLLANLHQPTLTAQHLLNGDALSLSVLLVYSTYLLLLQLTITIILSL